jgi:hypothetical protein
MDFHAIKARYNAAFDAYHEISSRNAESARGGKQPSAVDLEREETALGLLEKARRALFKAIGLSGNYALFLCVWA